MATTLNGIGKITAGILFVEPAFRSEIVLVEGETASYASIEAWPGPPGGGGGEVKERVVDSGAVGGEIEKKSRGPCGKVEFDFCEWGGGCLG